MAIYDGISVSYKLVHALRTLLERKPRPCSQLQQLPLSIRPEDARLRRHRHEQLSMILSKEHYLMATTFTNAFPSASEVETGSNTPRPGILSRFFTAIMDARHRAAEREIERYIMMHGGKLTDSIERDLSRTFGAPAGRKY
jgi:hypothetical protein